MNSSELDQKLKSYVQEGDPEALGRVFDLAAERLFSSALQLTHSAEEAEELLQETFLFLIAKPLSYDGARPALPFLLGVLQKKSLELRRRETRKAARVLIEDAMPARATETDRTRNQELRSAVDRLPDEYRHVLLSVLDEGMKPAEIAARSGESPGAIRTRLHRALGQLRKALPTGFALPAVMVALEGTSLAAVKLKVVEAAIQAQPPVATVAGAGAGLSGMGLKFGAVAAAITLLIALPLAIDRFQGDDETELGFDRPIAGSAGLDLEAERQGPARHSMPATSSDAVGRQPGAASTRTDPDSENNALVQTPVEIEIEEGEIAFHYRQGWSFARGARVDQKEDADIWFESSAGGLSSIQFKARAGIRDTQLEERELDGKSVSTDCYLRAILGYRPDLEFKSELRCDDRHAPSNVMLFKTASGGYGVAAIIDRKSDGGWTENDVVLRYRLNPREPVFTTSTLPPLGSEGLALDEQAFARDLQRERDLADWERRRQEALALLSLTESRAEAFRSAAEAEGGSVVALQDRGQIGKIMGASERKIGLRHGLGYTLSTYSFEHQTRDDVELTRNDWDFGFDSSGPGHIRVNTVTDDRSEIWDLGQIPLDSVGVLERPRKAGAEKLTIQVGHSYLIHTRDTDSELTAAMRVLAYEKDEHLIFSWRLCDMKVALEQVQEDPDLQLKEPVVRIQIRGGAGGGNPNRIFLDGSKNAYLDQRVTSPFSIDGPIDIKERARAYVEGGRIPRGMNWVIETITYRGSTRGDSNGHGEFVLQIGKEKIASIKESPEPFQGVWKGRIVLRPGDESRSFAEIANSSAAEVTLIGHFEAR